DTNKRINATRAVSSSPSISANTVVNRRLIPGTPSAANHSSSSSSALAAEVSHVTSITERIAVGYPGSEIPSKVIADEEFMEINQLGSTISLYSQPSIKLDEKANLEFSEIEDMNSLSDDSEGIK
ncbi:hypothetical protein A0J61_07536, partial [Choanephora cucurbitarum]